MNFSIKNKITSKLSKLVDKYASHVLQENFQNIHWLFDYLEANVMTYGNLWIHMEENIERLMNKSKKNSELSLVNFLEVKFLKNEQKKEYDNKIVEDDEEKKYVDFQHQTEILDLLNEAIVNCSFEDKQLLACLFFFRARQLSQFGQYKEALKNINFAIKFHPSKKYILYKVSFLNKLGYTQQAQNLFSWVSNSEQTESLGFKCMIEEILNSDQMLDEGEYTFDEDNNEDTQWTDGSQENVTNFEIDYRCLLQEQLGKGRFFIAKEDIPAERLILRERAYSIAIIQDSIWNRCYHCFRSVTNVFFPCHDCSEVVYCSSKCAQKSYVFIHKYECGLNQFWLERSKTTYHMFKLLNRFGIHKILDLTTNNHSNYDIEMYMKDRKQYEILEDEKDEETKLNAYRIYMDLMNHNDKHGLDLLVYHLVNAIECSIMAAIVQGFDINHLSREQIIQLIEISFQGIRRNLINSFRWSENDAETGKRSHIATCICLIGSLFNHHCDYNTEWTFDNGSIYLTTNRKIRKGEEISICYGCSSSAPLEDRIKQNQSYFFQCNCRACLEDAKTVLALQCCNCPGPVLLLPEIYDIAGDQDAKCMLCYKPYENTAKVYNHLNMIHYQIDLITKLFDCGLDKQKYSQLLIFYMSELSTILYSRGRILVDDLNKCCRVLYEQNLLSDCISYGILVDQILPIYSNELLKFDYKVRGIVKMVLENGIEKEIDWMIFWSDLFRRYIQKSRDDTLSKIMKRFYERLFFLLDYRIKQKQKDLENHDFSSSRRHSMNYYKNIDNCEEIKLLEILKKFKQDQLDSMEEKQSRLNALLI